MSLSAVREFSPPRRCTSATATLISRPVTTPHRRLRAVWGFRGYEELSAMNPTYLAKDAAELEKIIMG